MTARRGLVVVVAATLLAGIVAACGGGASTDDTVDFLTYGDPEELAAYRDLVAAFEEAEPGIDVRLVEAADRDDLLTRLSTSFAGGNPPDVFLVNYRAYGQFAAIGALEPVASRVEASSEFVEDDFFAVALDAFRQDGELTCLPQNISSLVTYYNRDRFAAAGVPEPEEGWTWNEMVGAAQRLTIDEDGDGVVDVHGLGIEPSIIRVAPFVWSAGGDIVDDVDDPTRFTLDEPAAQQALQLFLELGQTHGVIPSEEEAESEDDESRFLNGRLAMLLSSRRPTPTFRTITDFEWDIAPLPIHEEQAGILHSDAYCLAAASPLHDEAFRFVEFAVGPEGAPIIARSGRTVPSLESVARSEAFLDPSLPPAHAEVFLSTIPVIQRVPSISTWPEIEDVAEGILEEALYEGGSAAEVATQLDTATRDIFARAEP